MKTILVLTDFSKKAKYAAETALSLAGKMKADVLLFNAYPHYPFLPSAEFVAWPPEYYTLFKQESHFRILKEKTRLERLIAANKDKFGGINIYYHTAEGSPAENLQVVLKKKKIEIIVIGGREKTAGSFLFGDHMNQIIRRATSPVMVVSSKTSDVSIKNVVFATDLDPEDINVIQYLLQLSTVFHFHLHVCHVFQPPVFLPDFDEEDRLAVFSNALTKVDQKVSFKILEATHIANEIEEYCRKNHAELFVLVHKQHSLFMRLLQESPSKMLIRHQKRLILIIPRDEKK
jgi:nucleotide-binding universal stress UspA family protein